MSSDNKLHYVYRLGHTTDRPTEDDSDVDANFAQLLRHLDRLDSDAAEAAHADEVLDKIEAIDAAYHLGCSALSQGAERTAEQALRQAAEGGHPEAAYELAALLMKRSSGRLQAQREAARWLQEAISAGAVAPEDLDGDLRQLWDLVPPLTADHLLGQVHQLGSVADLSQLVVVGSGDGGFWLGSESEFDDWLRRRLRRADATSPAKGGDLTLIFNTCHTDSGWPLAPSTRDDPWEALAKLVRRGRGEDTPRNRASKSPRVRLPVSGSVVWATPRTSPPPPPPPVHQGEPGWDAMHRQLALPAPKETGAAIHRSAEECHAVVCVVVGASADPDSEFAERPWPTFSIGLLTRLVIMIDRTTRETWPNPKDLDAELFTDTADWSAAVQYLGNVRRRPQGKENLFEVPTWTEAICELSSPLDVAGPSRPNGTELIVGLLRRSVNSGELGNRSAVDRTLELCERPGRS